jgi:protein-tyrosine phosphatase
VIDLHAHILPGLDDGPPSLDASVRMAEAAVRAGTRVMAATSHINRGFGLEPAELAAARADVQDRLRRDAIELEVVQGGELSPGRAQAMDDEDLRALTLGGGRWLLLECPLSPAAGSLEPLAGELQTRGFGVLLAHPERSPSFQRGPDALERLVERGALAQVTAGAFAGDFGDLPRRTAFAMLERGLVHVLASDAHDPVHRAPDLMAALPALERRYEDAGAQAEWMTSLAPAAVLAGRPLPARPELPRRTGGVLRRFRA